MSKVKHKFQRLPKLSGEQVATLKALSKDLVFTEATGSRRRVGANGTKALSIYSYSKWFNWKAKERSVFRSVWEEQYLNTVVQGWFLRLPKRDGFLDVMDAWVDLPNSGTVVATALEDKQTIIIDDISHILNKGETIKFHLSLIHSIPKVKTAQLWACIMIREIL